MNFKSTTLALCGVLTLGVAMTFATDGTAGMTSSSALCTTINGTTGYCAGSFDAFRNNSDANAYASFTTSTVAGYSWFSAELGGKSYSCTVPAGNAALNAAFAQVAASSGYFMIEWNTTTSVCSMIATSASSAYHNSW